ncbi:coiled-coil domain-containing protein 103-like isoform X1 [Limulus polyphemus]|uniref:Coiled-coil domain-containing protein 103-like isoform X1 n=1 Tax=Limulus polyphemus TaxID=6850 RepID=A0ABM1SYB2_LIMPO|nr:coiled-coil domain-containing protein 103-like isoform X1 [Limulus polyphemus]XP_022248618.1 coiled-coil domain-containing protein 103-like isoform X1 [Limulus polyphemus]
MAAVDDDSIDFNQLEAELHAAVEADARYWRENDAKFRAVNQRVASYDEFRDMVKAAHLKPLQRDDKINGIPKKVWNSFATNRVKSAQQHQCPCAQLSKQPCELKTPFTSQEFEKIWHRHLTSTQDHYSFLKKLGGETLGQIFHSEIGFGLLGEILVSLIEFEDTVEDFCLVVEVLSGLSKAKRFGLTLQFLTSEEKAECKRLFQLMWQSMSDKQQDLAENGITELTLQDLMKVYEVKSK